VDTPRTLRSSSILIVVLYLCVAGWFFVLAPWSRFWSSHVVAGAPSWLMGQLAAPAVRGALSAFGLLHFFAAAGWLNDVGRPA
jgi:hypothetical protein